MNPVLHFPVLNSTNAYAKTHAQELADGTVVCADEQTAGRGRFDRVWVSQLGGLYFSLLLKPQQTAYLQNLTQLMAVSVCQAVRELGADAHLKWPNDVLVNEQKICGILSEAVLKQNRFYALVLGVGINVNQNSLPDVGRPAATLKNLGIPADKSALLNRVLTLFNARLKNALTQGFAAFAADYKNWFPYLGKTVSITNGGQKLFGVAENISSAGTLVVKMPEGLREFSIGDMNA